MGYRIWKGEYFHNIYHRILGNIRYMYSGIKGNVVGYMI